MKPPVSGHPTEKPPQPHCQEMQAQQPIPNSPPKPRFPQPHPTYMLSMSQRFSQSLQMITTAFTYLAVNHLLVILSGASSDYNTPERSDCVLHFTFTLNTLPGIQWMDKANSLRVADTPLGEPLCKAFNGKFAH